MRMRPWPRTLGSRVLLSMALAVGCLLTVSLVALRALSLEPGSDQIAELLAAHVVALRALSDQPRASDAAAAAQASPAPDSHSPTSPSLEVLRAPQPPEHAVTPWLPFARRLATSLEQRLGDGTRVLTEEGDESRLWVSPARPGSPWLGFRIPAFRTQALYLSGFVLIAACAIVLFTAWWLRRELARPLRMLADQAPALAAGELDAPPLDARVAREFGALSEALHRAGREARSAARERELLLAGLSHDLRTPLARMSYAVELLRGEDPALCADLRSDIEELDALIGALLQRARDASSEPVSEVDLPALLRQAIGSAQLNDWKLEGPARLVVRGQSLSLRRIADNLIGNAVRHARPPFESRWGECAGRVWFEIEDAGPGLPESVNAVLQAPLAALGSGPGGLGLAVARHLLAGMGGDLEVLPPAGVGARLRASWPVHQMACPLETP